MWIDKFNLTVTIDFTVKEMKQYLTKQNYKFVDLMIYKYNSEDGNYEENINCPVPGNMKSFEKSIFDEVYWSKSKIQSDREAIRLVFEYEMKKKLLTL